ncbi:hypothetical protein [Lactobacillus apis]|uniref:hypothetical protein n=1 Tax=Lactobacillus apis TaxID=303541 RepID=UPI00094258F0|nr:hypothetical protein [Lactobacillus apis]
MKEGKTKLVKIWQFLIVKGCTNEFSLSQDFLGKKLKLAPFLLIQDCEKNICKCYQFIGKIILIDELIHK